MSYVRGGKKKNAGKAISRRARRKERAVSKISEKKDAGYFQKRAAPRLQEKGWRKEEAEGKLLVNTRQRRERSRRKRLRSPPFRKERPIATKAGI